jgi:nicotinamidase-related amidase
MTLPAVPKTAALLLIDVQKGFDHPKWGPRNNPSAEGQMARLLAAFRETGRPVVHVRHMSTEPDSPLRPGQEGNEIRPEVAPHCEEPVFEKTVNSAFIGTRLEASLREGGIETLVIVGLITNHCVSTTARMASNLGFRTIVVADATATFDFEGVSGERIAAETMHQVGLAELRGEFATIANTEAVLAALRC